MSAGIISDRRVQHWGGAAFVVGNLLFVANKLNEMSRLFLGRPMPDVISGQNPALIIFGQVVLIIGYVAYYRFYSRRVGRVGKTALLLFSGGGIVLTFGHVSFMSVPVGFRTYAESLFLLVIVGLLLLLIGLIWFGILNLRRPVLSYWPWLPLVTGLMGFIGFVLLGARKLRLSFFSSVRCLLWV